MSDKKDVCSPQPFLQLDRPNYYHGQMLTARDFAAEQAYHLNRRYLLNRLLHGWGIVCGLNVSRRADAEEENLLLVVTAGVAIDGCGREIISPTDIILDLAALRESRGGYRGGEAGDEDGKPLLLCVRYCEEPAGFVPALSDPNGPDEMQATRIREKGDFVLRAYEEVDPSCWERDERPCLVDDQCPCEALVPLAGVFIGKQETREEAVRIDLSYRRLLAGGRL